MSEVLASRPRPVPPALPPLLSFAAGFIDSFTVLALFGMFVAQVTGSLRDCCFLALPDRAAGCSSGQTWRASFIFSLPLVAGRLRA
jgi:uncharacterized membrane protein YoaK (UPF0700 family)